jgi:hypothetical protein
MREKENRMEAEEQRNREREQSVTVFDNWIPLRLSTAFFILDVRPASTTPTLGRILLGSSSWAWSFYVVFGL